MTETSTTGAAGATLEQRLAGYVGGAGVKDAAFIAACVDEARALVAQRVGGVVVPAAVQDRAVLEVAADLYHRRRVRNGVAGFDGPDMTPVRVTRDPMKAAEDILGPFLGPGIA